MATLFPGDATAETGGAPLWKLGISTFTGKKETKSASDGPTMTMSMPSMIAPNTVAPAGSATTGESKATPTTIPAAYQIGSGAAPPLTPPLPQSNIPLPVPELPVPAELQMPLAPGFDPGTADPAGVANAAAESAAAESAIGQAIEQGMNAETAPLAEETMSWYQVPWSWVSKGWENHAELGLDGASGNSRTLAFQTGLEMKRKTDRYTLGMDFDYRKGTTTGITTEDNGRFNLDYDRLFLDSKWSAFGKFGAEWDQFKAFDSRLNLNGGIGYHFVRTDDALLAARFGAGASKEIGAPEDSWKPEAVFGGEAEYQVNRYNKIKGKVDFFPAWEDFSDYRLVTDVAWEILLDDVDNLSLKLAMTDRYDSTPQGAKPNDIYYSLLLLVKF